VGVGRGDHGEEEREPAEVKSVDAGQVTIAGKVRKRGSGGRVAGREKREGASSVGTGKESFGGRGRGE
jgi:hypothetical protein